MRYHFQAFPFLRRKKGREIFNKVKALIGFRHLASGQDLSIHISLSFSSFPTSEVEFNIPLCLLKCHYFGAIIIKLHLVH